jgi:hypothetical protein
MEQGQVPPPGERSAGVWDAHALMVAATPRRLQPARAPLGSLGLWPPAGHFHTGLSGELTYLPSICWAWKPTRPPAPPCSGLRERRWSSRSGEPRPGSALGRSESGAAPPDLTGLPSG